MSQSEILPGLLLKCCTFNHVHCEFQTNNNNNKIFIYAKFLPQRLSTPHPCTKAEVSCPKNKGKGRSLLAPRQPGLGLACHRGFENCFKAILLPVTVPYRHPTFFSKSLLSLPCPPHVIQYTRPTDQTTYSCIPAIHHRCCLCQINWYTINNC